LSFKGIRIEEGFCKKQIGTVFLKASWPAKLDVLGGFRNLKYLIFERCGNAVDDQVIQFIFREMTKLEEFHISHCNNFTDARLAGTKNSEGSENDSVSIQNLKSE